MFCKKCGVNNDDDSKFCSSCGASMNDEAVKSEQEKPQSPYPYRQAIKEEPRGFGVASWIFTGFLALKSFVMLVTILVVFLSGGKETVDGAIAAILVIFTWTSVGSMLGWVLTAFEILFALVFAIIQIIKNRSKFSTFCLVFAIIMSVITIALLVVYPVVVPMTLS